MKTKNLFVIIINLLITFLLITNVYAEENQSATVNLTRSSKEPIKVGEEIIIDVDITVNGFEGIAEFLANVTYDKEVLEYKEVLLQNDWNLINSNGKVYIEQKDVKDSKGKICSLKFVLLKEAKNTTIKLENIDAAGLSGSINSLDGNVNEPAILLDIERGTVTQSNNQINNINNNGSNNNTSNNNVSTNNDNSNNANVNSNNSKNNFVSSKTNSNNEKNKENDHETIFIIVGVVAVVAIISAIVVIIFLRLKKTNNNT